jgi:hypothetical protein
VKKARHTKGRPKGAKTKFPGIGRDAKALGVNVRSLQRVLSGVWVSNSLTARYAALKESQKAQSNQSPVKS